MKQAEVAEHSGYEEKYIGYLEHRKHTPSLTAMIEISKALKVPPTETLQRVLELMPKFAYLENTQSNIPEL